MKKYWKLLLLLVCILPLTGCLKKDAIDVEKFTSELEGRGFTVDKTTETAEGPKGMRVAYTASKVGVNYKVELYTFDGDSSAKDAFNNQKNSLESVNASKYVKASVDGLNYNTYTLQNDSGYYHLVRVEDKIIYAYGPAEDKGDMKDIIKMLGY